jgi:hypothetical protein
MNNFKKGDKILIESEVLEVDFGTSPQVLVRTDCGFSIWVAQSGCRPVEPPAVPDLSTMGVEVVSDLSGHRVKRPIETLTGSEINAKTKQCIIDYFMDKINARAEIGHSDWWTRESHIVNSKHIVAVLEHFKDKGYETELASDDVTISW